MSQVEKLTRQALRDHEATLIQGVIKSAIAVEETKGGYWHKDRLAKVHDACLELHSFWNECDWAGHPNWTLGGE